MIQQIFAVIIKELKVLWHDREALALLFAMPVFFILVMSLALEGVFEAGTRGRPVEILAINEDQGEEAQKVILALRKSEGIVILDSLEGHSLSIKSAEDLILKGKFRAALHFHRRFTEQIQTETPSRNDLYPVISMIVDPTVNLQLVTSIKGTVQGVIERQSLLHRLPRLVRRAFEGVGNQGDSEAALAVDALRSQFEIAFASLNSEALNREMFPLALIPLSASERDRRPTSTEQNVPAYTIFGVFFIVLTLASSFIKEKNDGTFQRILTAPLPKAALIIGKLLPYYLVNLVQIALMFAVGVVFFDLQLGNLSALILVSLSLAAAANGLGLLVATIGKTEAQVNGLSVLLAITLSALGGMMVPTFVMPGLMKILAQFTPHAWALSGYQDVIVRGMGVGDVLAETGVLAGFASLFFLIALWRFRFD